MFKQGDYITCKDFKKWIGEIVSVKEDSYSVDFFDIHNIGLRKCTKEYIENTFTNDMKLVNDGR